MAITKELLGNNKHIMTTPSGEEWLRSKLVPKYADSVELNGLFLYVKRDGVTILQYNRYSTAVMRVSAYYDGKEVTKADDSNVANQYGFTTSNGVCVCQELNGSYWGKVVFTLDNNGDTIVIMNSDFMAQTNNYTADIVKCGITVPSVPPTLQITPVTWTSTQIAPFPVYDPNSETPLYTPNCFYMMTQQFNVTGEKVNINGVSYLALGGWLLKDE